MGFGRIDGNHKVSSTVAEAGDSSSESQSVTSGHSEPGSPSNSASLAGSPKTSRYPQLQKVMQGGKSGPDPEPQRIEIKLPGPVPQLDGDEQQIQRILDERAARLVDAVVNWDLNKIDWPNLLWTREIHLYEPATNLHVREPYGEALSDSDEKFSGAKNFEAFRELFLKADERELLGFVEVDELASYSRLGMFEKLLGLLEADDAKNASKTAKTNTNL